MKSLPRWAPLACLACLAAWAVSPPATQASHGRGRVQTVYVAPAETVLAVPTTYVSSTFYALPTTYVSPTVYTSAYVPTTYYLSPTAYVIPSYRTTRYLSPRRYEYDLTPTTYYTPTVLDLPVAASYETPCETTVSVAPSISSSVSRAPKAPAPAAAAPAPRQAPRPIVSVPKEEPPLQAETKAVPDDVSPPPPAEPPPPRPEDALTPPPVPAEVPIPEMLPSEGDALVPGAPPRETLKPAAPSGGILEGKVVSGTTGQAEKGVKVVVSHRILPPAFVNREATTDALGRYAIDVPPGDWAVKIVRPDGKTYSVKNITVSGGRVTADDGQAVPSLVINL